LLLTKGGRMQPTSLDAARIRALLLEQRTALAASSQIAAESRAPVVLDQASVGRLSGMDAMQAQALALDIETSARTRCAALIRLCAARTTPSDSRRASPKLLAAYCGNGRR
jgi:hypothetical protein